ncbi:fungal specific transcription factor domain-containing protein [Sarocladium implicatum]|nr:fungal specific transcription factor domain-containing protein [Sarocladium implicatum]
METANVQARQSPAEGAQNHQQQHKEPSRNPSGDTPVPPVKRRGTVACRRCRRLRSKCIHESSSPPCEACRLAGDKAAKECMFPRRGEKDLDRQFRRRPVPAAASDAVGKSSPISDASAKVGSLLSRAPTLSREDVLPPTDEVVEGCRIFVTSYFQLGFIPKAVFLEKLVREPESVSPFLLSCILSISARFTPSLTKRYGGARQATDHFMEVSRQMVPSEMYNSSLERLQAFFLLSISHWGDGDRERSSIDMGIAVRMAGLQRLHCEESFTLSHGHSAEEVVTKESARRVFWMIQSQENLHSGYKTPAPFPLEDITTLLPCDEKDFAFGNTPTERAALAGTPPAFAEPQLASLPSRCLFATLIQAHSLWGAVSRKASRADVHVNKAPPWDLKSDYQVSADELVRWEKYVPAEHTFSVWNLRGWKSESLHLAYLAVTMVLRLTNIVSRRVYLDDMLMALAGGAASERLEPSTPTMANANDHQTASYPTPSSSSHEGHGPAPPGFWQNMSNELFSNVWQMHEQIDAYLSMRTPDEGFPQILVFCIYMCGSVSSYLWRYPSLCPHLADRAETMAQRSLDALSALHAAWPTSTTWQKGLQKITTPMSGPSPAESRISSTTPIAQQTEVTPQRSSGLPPQIANITRPPVVPQYSPQSAEQRAQGLHGDLLNVLPTGPNSELAARFGGMQPHAMPGEVFDMELTAFMQGDFHFNPYDPMPQGGYMYTGMPPG